jgi:hypothetical protein
VHKQFVGKSHFLYQSGVGLDHQGSTLQAFLKSEKWPHGDRNKSNEVKLTKIR